MRRGSLMVLSLLVCVSAAPQLRAQAPRPLVTVAATSSEIIVDYGPITLSHHASHDGPSLPAGVFAMPASGWLRGFQLELLDAAGRRLPQRMLHHLNLIAAKKRDLFTHEMLRIAAVGPETKAVTLPRFLGFEARRGDTLAVELMLHPDDGASTDSVTVRLRLQFTPRSSWLGAISLYPFSAAIGVRGAPNVFDLPPGRSEYYWEGSPAIAGRILGLGGHLHRYGVLL